MTDSEKLDLILSKIGTMQQNMDSMQGNINSMQQDIEVLKRTSYLVENDIAPKVQILLENHSDLAKNTLVAKDIEERVGSLEFDMKVIKNILKSRTA